VPSGELQPVVFQEPARCERTSKKFALMAMVGWPSACQACNGV
jgi:hypothetical protein